MQKYKIRAGSSERKGKKYNKTKLLYLVFIRNNNYLCDTMSPFSIFLANPDYRVKRIN